MDALTERLQAADATLAPYAVPHGGVLGREAEEPGDETRSPFQRDRDRIIHSQAFRRLQGKTQVFVAGEGDHYRTRLTHTLEVTQIARDVARTLRLNEDLAECIALSHDLGHPPFGHSGEEGLDAWLHAHGSAFEHNLQSLRIVTVLERHSSRYPGLNLNREVLAGILKHAPAGVQEGWTRTLEAQLVNMSDEIAYNCHDCDDGLRAGLFSIEDLASTRLAAAARERSRRRGSEPRNSLVHLLVSDLYATSASLIDAAGIRSLDDVRDRREPLIALSADMRAMLDELRGFLWERMLLHPAVRGPADAGKRLVAALCARLHERPTDKVKALQDRTGGSPEEAVKDYVAGMTDEFASLQARELGIAA